MSDHKNTDARGYPPGCAAAELTIGYPDNECWPKGTIVEILEHQIEAWTGDVCLEVWHVTGAHPGTVDYGRLRPLTKLAAELLKIARDYEPRE